MRLECGIAIQKLTSSSHFSVFAHFTVFLNMSVISSLLDTGKPRRAQLAITDIFNVLDALRQRGFVNPSEESIEKTLLCPPDFNFIYYNDIQACKQRALEFLDSLNDKNFRDKLRGIIFSSENVGLPEQELLGLKVKNDEATRNRYGKTIELLLAYLSVKELGALSASFGVHIEGAPNGGDFDCIANFQQMLFYFEAKSGKVNNIDESRIQEFLDRHGFLCPEMSVLFLDFKGVKDDWFQKVKRLRIYKSYLIESITRLRKEQTQFYLLDSNVVVVDLNKSGDVLRNLRSVMRYHWEFNALQKRLDFRKLDFTELGYSSEDL